jgi:putative mRNA 3-end processing factor
MEVRFLGGAREVGRSALLVDDSLLLDFGMESGDPPAYPLGMGDVDPDAVVVSHGHLDHTGVVPTLLSGDARPPIHWTPPTDELARLLARDTINLRGGTYDCPFTEEDVARLTEVSVHHGYREPFEAAGYEVTFFDAGHVPGSAHVLVDDGETRLLYAADFNTEDQRLVAGTTARPDADAVVCESTYADVERDPRPDVEDRFVDALRRTVRQGGTAVVPAFAIGRTQEAIMLCEAAGIDCYVDGMGVEVTRILRRHPGFLRDADALRRGASHARRVTGRDGQRRRIADRATVIVTTSGMLQGGPAMTYVPEVRDHPTNLVALVGHQVEGTPGRELLESGRAEIDGRVMPVSARVEAFDFSAHADRSGLLSFLDPYRDVPVVVNHGDRCEAFAEELRAEGYAASAPENGDAVELR